MPLVALRVLEFAQQENVSLNDIAEVIETDPALTVKLLKTANSPLFGLPKKISSIQQATVILGLRAVKVMALSFSLVDTLDRARTPGLDYRRYWRRSLTSAVASKLIAQELGTIRADEGLVGGLLCDIGMLAANCCAPELYAPVLERLAQAPAQPAHLVEQELLGITHAQISSELLGQWSLPEMLCEAVAAHHGEGLDRIPARTRLMASVLYAGASIAEVFCGDVPGSELSAIESRCLKLTPLKQHALQRILDALHTHVLDMASLFNVEIDDSISYEQLRTGAMVQLATLSLSAEIDRADAARRAERAQEALEKISTIASEFEREAATDALTQMPNRRAFDSRLATTLDEAQRYQAHAGLIMLDLDHFKKLNDTHGHQAGDEALRLVGQCLKEVCAAAGMAARYGGEEFGVIVAQISADALHELAEDIRRSVESISFKRNGKPVRVTASIGAAHVDFAHESATAQELIERADGCLYQAKRKGRNRVEAASQHPKSTPARGRPGPRGSPQ